LRVGRVKAHTATRPSTAQAARSDDRARQPDSSLAGLFLFACAGLVTLAWIFTLVTLVRWLIAAIF
jgi:hypothetical protein